MNFDKFLYYIGAMIFSIALGFYTKSVSSVFMSFGAIVMATEAFIVCLAYLNRDTTDFQDVDRRFRG